jgi:threonine dehydrogenase-like Zn-dependent dehydrogenase
MHAGVAQQRSSFVVFERIAMRTMRAAVFVEPGRIMLDEKPIPSVGRGDALIKVTTTTICGTDVHILKGEYPVAPKRIVGHEPVGVIEALGPGVTD